MNHTTSWSHSGGPPSRWDGIGIIQYVRHECGFTADAGWRTVRSPAGRKLSSVAIGNFTHLVLGSPAQNHWFPPSMGPQSTGDCGRDRSKLDWSPIQIQSTGLTVYHYIINTCRIYGSLARDCPCSTYFVTRVQSNSSPASLTTNVTSLSRSPGARNLGLETGANAVLSCALTQTSFLPDQRKEPSAVTGESWSVTS